MKPAQNLGAACLALLVSTASPPAGAAPGISAATAAQLKATLGQRLPSVRVLEIRPTPIAGLYEVVAPDGLLYVDASGDHLVTGEIVDTRTHHNLSREEWDTLNAVDFDSLPFALAIKTVRGDGSRRVAVFADPHCPYCQQLEGELIKEENITVFTFLLPLEDVHPGATVTARQLWCAADPAAAWSSWMLQKQAPAGRACASDPVKELSELASRLHISVTPTLLFPSGRRSAGLPATADLQRLLATETGATRSAAAARGGRERPAHPTD